MKSAADYDVAFDFILVYFYYGDQLSIWSFNFLICFLTWSFIIFTLLCHFLWAVLLIRNFWLFCGSLLSFHRGVKVSAFYISLWLTIIRFLGQTICAVVLPSLLMSARLSTNLKNLCRAWCFTQLPFMLNCLCILLVPSGYCFLSVMIGIGHGRIRKRVNFLPNYLGRCYLHLRQMLISPQ